MSIYQLTEEIAFPDPQLAGDEGLLALGGDLSPERLLLAYKQGIFPWYSEEDPILWWSPDPRLVLYPKNLKVSKSTHKVLVNDTFQVTFDKDCAAVIDKCKKITRPGQDGTWITSSMMEAYMELHQQGYVHSVEVWQDEELVGGLYGLSIGKCFFGESMFAIKSNASKVGFITLVRRLEQKGFTLIDCQVPTDHLKRLGAEEVERATFLLQLQQHVEKDTLQGNWGELLAG